MEEMNEFVVNISKEEEREVAKVTVILPKKTEPIELDTPVTLEDLRNLAKEHGLGAFLIVDKETRKMLSPKTDFPINEAKTLILLQFDKGGV